MGITSKSHEVIKDIVLPKFLPANPTVVELGSQNLYRGEGDFVNGKWKYADDMYLKELGFAEYMCIDLNGENDAKKWDLSYPIRTTKEFDLVTDFGTSEHVKDLHQVFENINLLCKVGGIMVHENPATGSWPKHGYHYRDINFYVRLAELAGYKMLHSEKHAAMGNSTDGWVILVVMRKEKEGFISMKEFPDDYSS